MYHLTADSEVVFFWLLAYFWGEGVGRRYSVDFNMGWRYMKIPVGFWGLTGI